MRPSVQEDLMINHQRFDNVSEIDAGELDKTPSLGEIQQTESESEIVSEEVISDGDILSESTENYPLPSKPGINKIVKITLYSILSLIGVGILVILFIFLFSPTPPSEAISASRRALASARKADADIFAPNSFKKANQLYNEAVSEFKKQNNRNTLSRDYSKLKRLSRESRIASEQAEKEAVRERANQIENASQRYEKLKKSVESTPKMFSKLPLPKYIHQSLAQSQILLTEAKGNLDNENFAKAISVISRAETAHYKYMSYVEPLLKNYFTNVNKWIRWQDETIAWSRNNDALAIVVEKMSHELRVYQSGKLIKTYDAELGKNWIGNKKYRGDRATPEGKYQISRKIGYGKTKWGIALLINYPNEDDRIRFNAAKASGELSRRATIGDMIEIHGQGGKGVDWTEGCIAVTDSEIERLYAMCSVGTPVTIIGSTKPLSAFIE